MLLLGHKSSPWLLLASSLSAPRRPSLRGQEASRANPLIHCIDFQNNFICCVNFQNNGNAKFLNPRQAFSRKRAASPTVPCPTVRFSSQNANCFTEVSAGGASRESRARGLGNVLEWEGRAWPGSMAFAVGPGGRGRPRRAADLQGLRRRCLSVPIPQCFLS